MTETLRHYIDGAPDADAARLGKALDPRRDIDPVAVDVIAVDDDIAEIDASADYEQLSARFVCRRAVAVGRRAVAHSLYFSPQVDGPAALNQFH